MKVAIIEDDKEFPNLVSIRLDTQVIPFAEVNNFKDDNFDVVLTDLRLKNTWGIETIIELRKKTAAPIVVLTGMAGPYLTATDMSAFLKAGANEVFYKEFVNDPTFKIQIEGIVKNGTHKESTK